MDQIKIIGVDCAVDRKNVGLAVGVLDGGHARLVQPQPLLGTKWTGAGAAEIAKWLEGDDTVLLAFDAPLGWPMTLSAVLLNHRAGDRITTAADEMFRRETDRQIQRRFGRRPLDVGADRIARTALAALTLLDEIRKLTGLPIPLAWNPTDLVRAQVIEVYPAGTLPSHGLPFRAYKGPKCLGARRKIIEGLHARIALPEPFAILEANDHLLDAVVCVLAGADFLRGEAVGPDEDESEGARKEGWIWVRNS